VPSSLRKSESILKPHSSELGETRCPPFEASWGKRRQQGLPHQERPCLIRNAKSGEA